MPLATHLAALFVIASTAGNWWPLLFAVLKDRHRYTQVMAATSPSPGDALRAKVIAQKNGWLGNHCAGIDGGCRRAIQQIDVTNVIPSGDILIDRSRVTEDGLTARWYLTMSSPLTCSVR